MKNFYKPVSALIITLFFMVAFTMIANAHTINYNMETRPIHNVVSYYLGLGFLHILPFGFDHILFVIGLYLMDSRIKAVIAQASCFTVAHTITLILVMNGTIFPNAAIVEPLIALSIMFIVIENIITNKLRPWRYIVVFLFGLVHGMGFANSLNEIGLPRNTFFTSLLSFNAGVELGQVTIILMAYLLIGRWFSNKSWYRQRIVFPLSYCIAAIALYWTVERIVAA